MESADLNRSGGRSRIGCWRFTALLCALSLLIAGCAGRDNGDEAPVGDQAGATENPLEGETLSFVVPFDPGGGYDTAARAFAPMLEEELDATIVVENEPGAGGLLAVNSMIAGDQDGSSFMIIPGVGIASASLAGAEGVQFDLDDLSYIGRTVADPHVFMVGADTDYESLADVMNTDGFRFASLGPGSAAAVNSAVLFEAFDGNPEIVSGFDGSGDIFAAIVRGDIDGMTLDNLDEVESHIEAGDVRALAVLGAEGTDVTPDVPTALDEANTDEAAEIMSLHNALIEIGRPLVTAPGVPEDVVAAYRSAAEAVLTDEDNVATLAEQGVPVDFMDAEDLNQLVAELADSPDTYTSLLEDAYVD